MHCWPSSSRYRRICRPWARGLRILTYLESKRPAPKAWLSAQTKELDRMLKPRNEVVLAAVRPVKLLLDDGPPGA
jgi:hypothetical protein